MDRIYGKSALVPDPQGYSILFDSTQWQSSIDGKLLKSNQKPLPGINRGMVANKGILYGLMPLGQKITVYSAILTNNEWSVVAMTEVQADWWQSFYFIPEYYGSTDAIIYLQLKNDSPLINLISVVALEDL